MNRIVPSVSDLKYASSRRDIEDSEASRGGDRSPRLPSDFSAVSLATEGQSLQRHHHHHHQSSTRGRDLSSNDPPPEKSIASGYKAMMAQSSVPTKTSGTARRKLSGDDPARSPAGAMSGGAEEDGHKRSQSEGLLHGNILSPRWLTEEAKGGVDTDAQSVSMYGREELQRKIQEMEDNINKTREQCLELLSLEDFTSIYSFFATNVTDRDNALNDQQLAEAEAIVMRACSNALPKAYLVLFSIHVRHVWCGSGIVTGLMRCGMSFSLSRNFWHKSNACER
jgi:hypothetical protein